MVTRDNMDAAPRPPTPEMAQAIADVVGREYSGKAIQLGDAFVAERDRLQRLLDVANEQLKNARTELATVANEMQGVKTELSSRPSVADFDSANRRVSELEARVTELQEELNRHPQTPDQVLDLVREQLDPVFQRQMDRLKE